MKRLSSSFALLLILGAVVMISCTTSTSKKELELTSFHPADDHRKIAVYYNQQAARLRQASADLSVRIDVYERLFGDTSDWVNGTRLLAQSYQEAAKEYERKANEHLELIREPRPPSVPRSGFH